MNTYPYAVVLGDFNKDGKLDIVTANVGVSVLLGQGNGTFAVAKNPPLGNGSGPFFILAADFDGDGKQDLVAARNGDGCHSLSLMAGNGDGTFQTRQNYDVGDAPNWIALGDFNDDTDPDILVTNTISNDISLLLDRPSSDLAVACVDSPDPVAVGGQLTFIHNGHEQRAFRRHCRGDQRRVLGPADWRELHEHGRGRYGVFNVASNGLGITAPRGNT